MTADTTARPMPGIAPKMPTPAKETIDRAERSDLVGSTSLAAKLDAEDCAVRVIVRRDPRVLEHFRRVHIVTSAPFKALRSCNVARW